jgi:lactam utilization protein B
MSGSDGELPARNRSIDLNADLGEGFPNDRALLDLVTSANICCGAHAGTPLVIRQTLRDSAALGVSIGAHPAYADREGFGRREQDLTTLQVLDLITSQITALMSLAAEVDATVAYLKPHGALYNQAQREPHVARALVDRPDICLAAPGATRLRSRIARTRTRRGLRRRRFPRTALPKRWLARST